jgi:hypothetical protein
MFNVVTESGDPGDVESSAVNGELGINPITGTTGAWVFELFRVSLAIYILFSSVA